MRTLWAPQREDNPMTRVHNRHARMTHREMQLAPAETHPPVEIVGSHAWTVIPLALVLTFVLTVIWAWQ